MLRSILVPTIWLSFTILVSNALKINFYDDERCQGNPLRSWVLDIGGKNTLGEYWEDLVGEAKSANVEGMTDEEREVE
jgi:hypothetical protein